MAAESRNDNIHRKLLLLQIPQWVVGLITLVLGIKLLTNPLLPEAIEVAKDVKRFLEYATICGGWNVMALPVATLLYIFPTPVKPPMNPRRMIATALLELTCVLLWFGLLVWKLKSYVYIDGCDIDGCKGFLDMLKYFALVTITMAVLSALRYHSYDKKRRKDRQTETERTLPELLQQPPREMHGADAAVSIIEEEGSLETRSQNNVAGSTHSRAGLIQEGELLEMRSPDYITSSTRSRVSSIQEVEPLEMISPNYITNLAARPQLSVAEPSGLLPPNYIASSPRSQVAIAGGDGVASPAPVTNIPQEERGRDS